MYESVISGERWATVTFCSFKYGIWLQPLLLASDRPMSCTSFYLNELTMLDENKCWFAFADFLEMWLIFYCIVMETHMLFRLISLVCLVHGWSQDAVSLAQCKGWKQGDQPWLCAQSSWVNLMLSWWVDKTIVLCLCAGTRCWTSRLVWMKLDQSTGSSCCV